jgi:membrane-bound lytic murein transglycosylase A
MLALARLWIALVLIGCLSVASGGCRKKTPPPIGAAPDYAAELPAGMLALRKIPPEQYPQFSMASNDLSLLRRAIDQSVVYMNAPSSRQFFPYLDIPHDRATATLHAMRAMIDEIGVTSDNARLNTLIRERFEVYQSIGGMGADGQYTNEVLFTGYCTPIYDASRTQTPEFRYPLYKRPPELVSDPVTGDVNPPYLTRRQIEKEGALAGKDLELVWLKDPMDAYVITIQGSARLRLTDGQMIEIGYNGHNGHAYTSPGMAMVNDGVIKKSDLSLKTLRNYFRANPQAMDTYLLRNDRYVFFTPTTGGPFGSIGVPVTHFHTIATDKSVYPRAMPAFLMTRIPTGNYRGFMLDQDTGGAIRAAGRCDIYMGIGPQAEDMSGQQQSPGQLYYVAVKPELVEQYTQPTATAGR